MRHSHQNALPKAAELTPVPALLVNVTLAAAALIPQTQSHSSPEETLKKCATVISESGTELLDSC